MIFYMIRDHSIRDTMTRNHSIQDTMGATKQEPAAAIAELTEERLSLAVWLVDALVGSLVDSLANLLVDC